MNIACKETATQDAAGKWTIGCEGKTPKCSVEDRTHCTHPNQSWCDCDWCRFVRSAR